MSSQSKKQMYDDIVLDYAATKTNSFKLKHEEPKFWSLMGDVKDLNILDFGCGSGYSTRQLKEKGAKDVVGVDISGEMIKQARHDEMENPLGISYHVGDAVNYISDRQYDIFTATYLFCYAETRERLEAMCQTMFKNIRPGGRLISVSTVLDKTCKLVDMSLGYRMVACPVVDSQENKDDLLKVDYELYSEDRKSKACFQNYLWRPEIIEQLLYSSGFTSVKITSILSGVPRVIFTAIRPEFSSDLIQGTTQSNMMLSKQI